jgi:hypothetical protein
MLTTLTDYAVFLKTARILKPFFLLVQSIQKAACIVIKQYLKAAVTHITGVRKLRG